MGIDLYCREITFGTSYTYWNTIRANIIYSTFDYLSKFSEKEIDNNHGLFYLSKIKQIINKIRENNISSDMIIEYFKSLLLNDYYYNNAFIYFNVGGLYALCNKNDTEEFYSSGNSFDICELFNIIEPYMKKYEGYESIYIKEGRVSNTIYEVFKQSVDTREKVSIY
jgi:hypothetical protein